MKKMILASKDRVVKKYNVNAEIVPPTISTSKPHSSKTHKRSNRKIIASAAQEIMGEELSAIESPQNFNDSEFPNCEADKTSWIEETSVHYRRSEESYDVTTLYLNEIGYIPLLTADQEVQLAREIAGGSLPSKHRMIESNLRLVVAVAKRFQNRGLCLLDLVEEGNLGLMRAVEKFDPELGFRFSTYATWWIKQAIDRALMNQGQTVRYPVHIMKDIQQCVRTLEQLRDTLAREPFTKEVAAKLGKTPKDVKKLLGLHLKFYSADQPVGEEGESSLLDNLPGYDTEEPAEVSESTDIKNSVATWLGKLSQRHREVVVRRFGLQGHDDCTLEEVGADVGITRERVRQLQLEALGKLKRMLEREGFCREHLHK